MKDFRSKMQRISEEKMQSVQMMSWAEWLQSCFSPQIEVAPVDGLCDRNEGFIKITMHFNQSQVHSHIHTKLNSINMQTGESFNIIPVIA